MKKSHFISIKLFQRSVILSIKISIFILIFFGLSIANNPFLTPQNQSSNEEKNIQKDSIKNGGQEVRRRSYKTFVPSLFQPILIKTARIQRKLNKYLTILFKKIKNGENISLLFLVLFFSFFYGIIHALGPGHGKIIISSFMLTHKERKITSIKIGSLVAIIHGFSAIVVVLGIYFIFKKGLLLKFDEVKTIIDTVSSIIIILLGVYLLIHGLYSIFKKVQKEDIIKSKKSLFVTALSIGIVPCPGAALILLFSINKDLIYVGVLAVIAMSLGMAITISSFGWFASFINKSTGKFIKNNRFLFFIENGLSLIGAAGIIFLGVLLLL